MPSDLATRQWTLVLVLTALLLSLIVVGEVLVRYSAAYWAAPREIAVLLESADSSLQDNEGYDRDVAKIASCDDKIRLSRLLIELQRADDDLRDTLNNILVVPRIQNVDCNEYTADYVSGRQNRSEKSTLDSLLSRGLERRRAAATKPSPQSPSLHTSCDSSIQAPPRHLPRLRATARILWASNRKNLEERLRRLDLLRMRFLVVYMGIVAATATAAADSVRKSAEKSAKIATTTAARVPMASAASRSSSSSSNRSSSGGSSCSSSGSSAANSPLVKATQSMPATPRSPTKSAASIVAASISAAAAAALAAGDTDDQYYPFSPTSMPNSPGLGQPHPFLRSIQQKVLKPPRQPLSPPSTPSIGPSETDDLAENELQRKSPTRRATTLGIRPPIITPENNHRAGWMDVVQELQRSPLLHKRHTSAEMSTTRR
ncbi:hypothetical protein SEPCBS57363_005192 [Sporothrix epigloea]|uniref:Uncharacterized protein n=1 Tax=Sporothrix epigloea TaxID=1892477 RepID=A0ABP0DY37_9PEZI